MNVTKDMTIGSVVETYPQTIPIFQRYGMGCLGCPATAYENVEQGALMHGIDIDELMTALNQAAA